MIDDVTVIAWGEFGRTPRINPQAGRDQYPVEKPPLPELI